MKPGKDYIGVGVGAMIFNDKGELLMIKRGPKAKNERGCWNIPGGTLDFGETRAQAVVREVKEELDVDIVVEHELLSTDHIIPDEGQHWVTMAFVVHIKAGQVPKIMEPHKHEDIGWFSLDKLPHPLALSVGPALDTYNLFLKGKGA